MSDKRTFSFAFVSPPRRGLKLKCRIGHPVGDACEPASWSWALTGDGFPGQSAGTISHLLPQPIRYGAEAPNLAQTKKRRDFQAAAVLLLQAPGFGVRRSSIDRGSPLLHLRDSPPVADPRNTFRFASPSFCQARQTCCFPRVPGLTDPVCVLIFRISQGVEPVGPGRISPGGARTEARVGSDAHSSLRIATR